MQFEVRVPNKENPNITQTAIVEARDAISALRAGLEQLGDSIDMSSMLCDFSDPECVKVTDSSTGRVIEVGDHDPSAAPAAPNLSADNNLGTAPFTPAVAGTTEVPALGTSEEGETPTLVAMDGVSDELSNAPDLAASAPDDNEGNPTVLNIPSFVEEPKDVTLEGGGHAFAGSAPNTEQEYPSVEPAEPVTMTDDNSRMDFAPASSDNMATSVALTPVEAPATTESEASMNSAPPHSEEGMPSSLSIQELTGAKGQYVPGMTTETLANVFMRAMEVYDYSDKNEAMKFVLELGMKDVSANGGAVLLTDINSPDLVLWFEAVEGPKSEELLNLTVPVGQGVIGYSAQQGVTLVVADVEQEPRYKEDILGRLGLDIGSLLCVPIQHEKRVYGAVVFYNLKGERPYSQGEASILAYLAHVAGEYLGQ